MFNHPKYNRGSLYLSGGMQYADNEGAGWRSIISPILKDMGYFPLDISELDQLYAAENGKALYGFKSTDEHGLMLRKATIRKHFVQADLKLIENHTDALIVYYDESARRGAGTISECQYAYLHDIPIFIVSAWEDWCNEVPGWLHALSSKVFTSFEDLLVYLERLPRGILKKDRYGNHHSGEHYLCSLSGEPFVKQNHHFVSKVSPLYSKEAVGLVKEVNEDKKDRYEFFLEWLESEVNGSTK